MALWKEGRIDDNFFQRIRDLETPQHRAIEYTLDDPDPECIHSGLIDAAKCDVYICCFSMKADSLDMWRYYSKGDGGYALKLSPSLFGEDVFSISEDPYGKFSCIQGCKVIYKAEEKIAFLSDKILNVYSAYQHDTECGDPMKEAEYILLKYFQTFQYKFKHECFSSEQEYRFIFYLPHKKPEKVQQILPQIEYETKNGVVIPHIEWEIEDGKSNLFEVVISPYVTEAYAEATTRDLLKSRGFTQCDVTKSALPVRF